ncbi:MAG: hypothetical protein LBP36_00450 [Oscillospiraceae bacterium]|jgi:hypothetical protein|nr:hypothetical protein [Oscillospiraceae bacterium]
MKFKFGNIAFAAIAFVFMAYAVPSKAILGDAEDPIRVSFFGLHSLTAASVEALAESFPDGCVTKKIKPLSGDNYLVTDCLIKDKTGMEDINILMCKI